jgi:translation initiation factor 3 subunit E
VLDIAGGRSEVQGVMTKLTNDSLQLTLDQINALYRYGYFQYSCGNYGEASSYLYHFRVLSTDPVLTVSSHWGKLASDILTGDWDRALEELKLLRDFIDTSRPDEGGHEAVLQKRTWLLHWSLFVWFNHPEGREGLVEMFFSTPYLNTIQTTCWWLLRYLVTSLIITRRSSRVYVIQTPLNASNPGAPATTKLTPTAALQDITRILTQESHRIGDDPILKFVQELYCNFNFDAAQQELKRAQEVAKNDFFIGDHADEFIESARFLVSEAYCRIHQRVDIADLSNRLNMSQEEGEKWIVNLIRDTRADAKIDFKEGMVYMNQTNLAVYQTVIEKTRGFTFRSAAMGQAMDRKAHPITTSSSTEQRGGRGGGRGGRGGRGGGRGGAQGANGGDRQGLSNGTIGDDTSNGVQEINGSANHQSEAVAA